ncbi:uncharacterized protein LOC127862223 [Dreissena polymorpha]|uniref:J domain-containing protein n=1 Tax=Dreissena polymorpha TaxID=45954 RepID=A0A9D3Y8C8_DREPO|nr:uncharacterized protein LOC127862223 [Dreissena polymorpha]KAH3695773.1 hypothetical protein DPMN_083232 [Dreissena polymorpha]
MDEKKRRGVDRQFSSRDADFGVFQPMDGPSNSYPSYSDWTPFSGLSHPPPSNDAYGWDSFVTPPTSPATFSPEINSANYFAEFEKMMSSIGKPNNTNFDSCADDTEKLASTPLAQSLFEALSAQSSMMGPMSAPLITGQTQMDFGSVSQDGYEIYAEALKKLALSSSYDSYDQFCDTEPFDPSPTLSPSPKELILEDTGNNSTKPSYSEVAKILKSSPASDKGKEETGSSVRGSSESHASRSFKGTKKFVPRPVRGRNNSVPGDVRPSISPDSKYGLDDFGDVGKRAEKEEFTAGLTGIHLTRKNSTSSLSSGTSGIEEIHLMSNNSNNICDSEIPKFEKISNKEKERDEKAKNDMKTESPKPFFDAKRIFETKDTNKRQQSQKKVADEDSPPLLNNGKPSVSEWSANLTHKKSTHYINNNLRDSHKKTNQNPSSDCKETRPESLYPEPSGKSEKSTKSRTGSSKVRESAAKSDMPLQTNFDHELIDEWVSSLYEKGKLCLNQLWTLLLMVVLLLFSIVVYLVSGTIHICSWLWVKLWTFLEKRVFKGKMFGAHGWGKGQPEPMRKVGLEENIALPSTGDEAMQRLLACKGKDPYSILGLKATATDDDIKKYYRRQAVLVHPDKNQQAGAEEAFKILGHAFDLIGDASKRQAYNRQLQEAKEAEAAMHEFNDLLTKLQEKLFQASNMMRCDNCGGKHKRVPVERPWYSARYCNRCSIRHSAKEGDVWAETSMLGFLWHYYACMEGKVYDITEWVACKRDFFKHMQANAHHVFYRIATEGNRGGHHTNRNSGNNANSEADLEDFISHLFHQAMNEGGGAGSGPGAAPGTQSWQPSQPNSSRPWPSQTQTSDTAGKRRKKKRKH